jgi:hypothetical protein
MVYVMAGICINPSFVPFRYISAYPRKSPSNRHATYHQTLGGIARKAQQCLDKRSYHDTKLSSIYRDFILRSKLQPFSGTQSSGQLLYDMRILLIYQDLKQLRHLTVLI